MSTSVQYSHNLIKCVYLSPVSLWGPLTSHERDRHIFLNYRQKNCENVMTQNLSARILRRYCVYIVYFYDKTKHTYINLTSHEKNINFLNEQICCVYAVFNLLAQ